MRLGSNNFTAFICGFFSIAANGVLLALFAQAYLFASDRAWWISGSVPMGMDVRAAVAHYFNLTPPYFFELPLLFAAVGVVVGLLVALLKPQMRWVAAALKFSARTFVRYWIWVVAMLALALVLELGFQEDFSIFLAPVLFPLVVFWIYHPQFYVDGRARWRWPGLLVVSASIASSVLGIFDRRLDEIVRGVDLGFGIAVIALDWMLIGFWLFHPKLGWRTILRKGVDFQLIRNAFALTVFSGAFVFTVAIPVLGAKVFLVYELAQHETNLQGAGLPDANLGVIGGIGGLFMALVWVAASIATLFWSIALAKLWTQCVRDADLS